MNPANPRPAAGWASSISAAPGTNTTVHTTGSTTTAVAAIIHAASNRRPNGVTDSPNTNPPKTYTSAVATISPMCTSNNPSSAPPANIISNGITNSAATAVPDAP